MPRTVTWDFRVAWDGVSYVDETSRLIQASGDMGVTAPGASVVSPRGYVSQMSVELANHDGRYSPRNSSGPLYSNIQNGGAYLRPCYLRVSIDGGSNYYRVFTGVLKLPEEQGATWDSAATVRIDCRDRCELLLNRRMSTSNSDFKSWHNNGYNEAQVIGAILTNAGLSAGTDYVVDQGIVSVPFAWLDDESPVEECWTIAAACGGRFYCDPDGVFQYENAANWLAHTSTALTLTTANVGRFVPSYDDSNLYSDYTVEAAPRVIGNPAVLWQPSEEITVAPGKSKTITASFKFPGYTVDAVAYQATTNGGVDITSSVTVSTTAYAQRATLTIANAHSTQTAVMRKFAITGRPVQGSPTLEETASSSDSFWSNRGKRTRRVSGNPYVQGRSQAAMLAAMLRDSQQLPLFKIEAQDTPGTPSLRLGDRVSMYDDSIMSAAMDTFVVTIRWRLNGQGFKQDIAGVDAGRFYTYAPSPGYFEIGTDTPGGSKVCFY